MRTLLDHGLAVTAHRWPPLRAAYALVHRAVHVLTNATQQSGAQVQQAYQEVLTAIATAHAQGGPLAAAWMHFCKVTASYAPGLFATYDVPGLPRTNNGLEQYFGAARHTERRATGRKAASPGLVVRGAVRVLAAVTRGWTAAELVPTDLAAWRRLRQPVDDRHALRRQQSRFRRNPAAYLAKLEATLLKPDLPS